VNELRKVVPVEWEAPVLAETTGFAGAVEPVALNGTLDKADIISCADPHHEVVEAFRWVRKLLSMKLAKPSEIAVAAAAPGTWDEHVLALAAASRPPASETASAAQRSRMCWCAD
jgi:hypothetical protein